MPCEGCGAPTTPSSLPPITGKTPPGFRAPHPPGKPPWAGKVGLLILISMFVVWWSPSLLATERFPRPDLGPEYKQPVAPGPLPRAALMGFIDLGVLFAALSIASWLVLKRRDRKGTFWLTIACLAYFGFYRKGCVCPIGAIGNVTEGIFVPGYTVPVLVVAFFVLPLIFALYYGRVFCSGVCPLGAMQDLVLLKPYRVPPALDSGLGLIRHVYLGAAVLFAATATGKIICDYDPFVAFFRVTGKQQMLLLGACFLGVGMFIGRPYCRYFCPYGVLLGWMSRFSKHRVTITPSECVLCNMCEERGCPFGAIVPPTSPSVLLSPHRGKVRLVAMLLLAPVLIFGGAWLGHRASGTMARANPTVRLLEEVEQASRTPDVEPPDTVLAFRGSNRTLPGLKADAAAVERRFAVGGALLFGFVGLALAATLIGLSVRRTREFYEADRATCLACARCYVYCPVEHESREAPLEFHDACQV